VRSGTIAAVRGHLAHWHGPFIGERSSQATRSEDVADPIALMHAGRRPSAIQRSKSSRRRRSVKVLGTLQALFGFAVKRGWASSNPVDSIELPEVTHRTAGYSKVRSPWTSAGVATRATKDIDLGRDDSEAAAIDDVTAARQLALDDS
jgi:hypothetical protein